MRDNQASVARAVALSALADESKVKISRIRAIDAQTSTLNARVRVATLKPLQLLEGGLAPSTLVCFLINEGLTACVCA